MTFWRMNRLRKKATFGAKILKAKPQGLKPPIDSGAVAARLKPCPFKATTFSAACEAARQSPKKVDAGGDDHKGCNRQPASETTPICEGFLLVPEGYKENPSTNIAILRQLTFWFFAGSQTRG